MSLHRSIAALCAIVLIAGCNAGHPLSPLPAVTSNSAVSPQAMRPSDSVPYGPANFTYTGGTQSYVVPSGVTSVTITAWGAGSGGISGGLTQATVPVKSGEKLSVVVGGAGQRPPTEHNGGAGGFNGGGNGGNSNCCKGRTLRDPGAGGGGASTVLHQDGSYAVVAGGAGGTSGSFKQGGAGGGTNGQNGPDPYGGKGGTGGSQSCGHPSVGTQGSTSVYGGGGGGGGYCGGTGGGGSRSRQGDDVGDSGGGGGSGYFEKDATGSPFTNVGQGSGGDGRVLIVPPPKIFTLATGIYALHVAVDAHGNAYASLYSQSWIDMISPTGTVTRVGSGLYHPEGIGVDADGNVYVADNGHGAVKKIAPPFNTPTHGTITTLIGGNLHPTGLALDYKGNVYVTATSEGALRRVWWGLRRINIKTHDDSIVYWDYTDKNVYGFDLAVDPFCAPAPSNRCNVLVDVITNKHELWNISYDGTVTSKRSEASLGLVPRNALALSNGILYVTDSQANKVHEVAGGTITPIGSGWDGPAGIAVKPGCGELCTVWVTEGNNGHSLKMWVP